MTTLRTAKTGPQLQALLADNGIAQDASPADAYSALRAIKVHRRPTGNMAHLAPDTYAQIKERLRHFSLIDSAMRTSPDNFSQGADDEAPQDIDFTAGLPQKLNARIHSTITLDRLQFLIVCTDGSLKINDLGDHQTLHKTKSVFRFTELILAVSCSKRSPCTPCTLPHRARRPSPSIPAAQVTKTRRDTVIATLHPTCGHLTRASRSNDAHLQHPSSATSSGTMLPVVAATDKHKNPH